MVWLSIEKEVKIEKNRIRMKFLLNLHSLWGFEGLWGVAWNVEWDLLRFLVFHFIGHAHKCKDLIRMPLKVLWDVL